MTKPRKGRYTTAEITTAEGDWEPPAPPPSPQKADEITWFRVGLFEQDVRDRVKAAGGKWDPARKLWKLPASKIQELGLGERVVKAVPGV